MVRHSGIRWFVVLCVAVGLAATVFAMDKVQPTPGAIALGNFDSVKTKIQPYDDLGGNRRSKSKTEITKDAIEGENALQYTFKLDGWCGIALARSGKSINWDWSEYASFSFWFKGANSGVQFGLDLQDKADERYTVYFTDDSTEWKHIVVPLSDFQIRQDFQDPSANKNGTLDYPLKAFAIYPVTPKGEAVVIFDNFEVLPKQ